MRMYRLLLCGLLIALGSAPAAAQVRLPFRIVAGIGSAPATPNTPFPSDGATNISFTPTLTAVCSGGTTYTIDFGTDNPPSNIVSGYSLVSLSYAPATLANDTEYFWTIHCTNAGGTTDGPVWSFTTTDDACTSPTGRMPVFLTCAQEAILEREAADYALNPTNPATDGGQIFKRMVEFWVAKTGTVDQHYGDFGGPARYVYQATGDPVYGAQAHDAFLVLIARMTSEGFSDFNRDQWVEALLGYDALYPLFTSGEKTTINATFNAQLQLEIDHYHFIDSDQDTSAFFASAMLSLAASSSDNPDKDVYLAAMGGLTSSYTGANTYNTTATSPDVLDFRKSLNMWLYMAYGGQWIESGEYNLGTYLYLLMGYQAMNATGHAADFPLITAQLQNMAKAVLGEISPDLNAWVQWGDTQHPRVGLEYERWYVLMALSGLLQDDPVYGPALMKAVWDLKDKYGYDDLIGVGGHNAISRAMYLFNPYADVGSYSTQLSQFSGAVDGTNRGSGRFYAKDCWGANCSLFYAALEPSGLRVDHRGNEAAAFGNFQLYRKGEWVATNPIGYGQGVNYNNSMNTMLMHGLGPMNEIGFTVAQESASDFDYIAGFNGGRYRTDAGWSPDVFSHEWNRSFVNLRSTDGHSDVVLIFDRCDVENPKSIWSDAKIIADFGTDTGDGPGQDDHDAREWRYLLNSPTTTTKTWILHMPVNPTVAGSTISWDTSGGQHVKNTTLYPASPTITVYDESNDDLPEILDPLLRAYPNDVFLSSETKWQARITKGSEPDFLTFLNGFKAYDTSFEPTLTAITGDDMQGALVTRSAHDDYLVLFNALGPHSHTSYASTMQTWYLRTTSFTESWSSVASSTWVILPHMSPSTTWHYTVDGGGSNTLTVDSQGFGKFQVSGSGPHTFAMTAS